jgi:hypothetical protein
MRYTPIEPPRSFEVGLSVQVEMKDCARLHLEPDEQVTFLTETGAEYDVARKDFGYYATPSLNGRLQDFGLRAVLVRNRLGRYFIMLVERGKDDAFSSYVTDEQLRLVCWLDSNEALQDLERKVTGG